MRTHTKLWWMRTITIAMFAVGFVTGLYRYDGLTIFLAIVIAGDVISDAISNLRIE